MKELEGHFSSAGQVGELFFKYRDYTPIPLVLLLFIVAKPSLLSVSVALLCIFLGEFLRVYSVSYIGEKSRTRGHGTGDKLVTDGPYAFSRNPLYLANFFIFIGFCFFSGKIWFIVLGACLFLLQYHYIIQFEEELLQERYGSSYQEYCEKVQRLFPKSFPSLSDLKMPEDFFKSLYTEKRTLLAIGLIWLLLLLIS